MKIMEINREDVINSVNNLYHVFYNRGYEEASSFPLSLVLTGLLSGVIPQLEMVDGNIKCGDYTNDIEMVCQALRNLCEVGTIEGVGIKLMGDKNEID